jgi:hypothetical protein
MQPGHESVTPLSCRPYPRAVTYHIHALPCRADPDVVCIDADEDGPAQQQGQQGQQQQQGQQGHAEANGGAADGQPAPDQGRRGGARCPEFRAFDAAECRECGGKLAAALEGARRDCAGRSWGRALPGAAARVPPPPACAPPPPLPCPAPPPPNPQPPAPAAADRQSARAAVEQERAALVELSMGVQETLELGERYYLLPRRDPI